MEKEHVKLLLVEDDPGHIELILRGFESTAHPFDIQTASSLSEARAKISGQKPNIVIADYILPDGKGDELLALGMQEFPIVVMTSHGNEQVAVEVLKKGAMDYVVKSSEMLFDMPHVANRVLEAWGHLLARKRAEKDRKELEEKLRRAERMESLGVMACGIAHDLNNTLGPIIMLPELIREDVKFLARQISAESTELKGFVRSIEADLTVIEESSRRAVKTIKDLLTMGRRGRYDFEPVSLNTLIEASLQEGDFIALRREKPEVGVISVLEPEMLYISGSPAHLHRVLANLYHNSFDAITKPGKIWIKTRRVLLAQTHLGYEPVPAGDYAVIEVMDTGGGIPQEHLTRLFEPFFSTKKQSRKSGTGLGLSIVHGIIKDHNGFIDVWSTENIGTTFRLYLPVLENQSEEVKIDSTKRLVRGGTEHILIVDDEPDQISLTQRALEKYGYTVESARNGEKAIEKLTQYEVSGESQKKPFDLVLLDMFMDGLSGLETYKKIRSICPTMKVLIVSGRTSVDIVRDLVTQDLPWLYKPYTRESLGIAVRRALDGNYGPSPTGCI